jgi:hypothetical protein
MGIKGNALSSPSTLQVQERNRPITRKYDRQALFRVMVRDRVKLNPNHDPNHNPNPVCFSVNGLNDNVCVSCAIQAAYLTSHTY